MHRRIRGFIDMCLGSVRGCEHEVVSGLDEGHRRNDGLVEIVAGGAGATTLNLDARSVGTKYENGAFAHWTPPYSDVQSLLSEYPSCHYPSIPSLLNTTGAVLRSSGEPTARRSHAIGQCPP